MPQTNEGVLLFIGAIFFLIGLLGGGFEISAIRIPSVGKFPRIVSAGIGLIFMATATSRVIFPPLSPQSTITPAVTETATSNSIALRPTPIPPTYTPLPATFTPTPTPTNTVKPIDMPTETSTPIPPSVTPSFTPTLPPTATPTPIPTATSTPIPTLVPQLGLIIDDFENYNNTSIINDFVINRNVGNEGNVILVGLPHVYQGRQALAFEFDIRNSRPNHYIGFDREFLSQDWSNYSSLCLWVESDGSNRSLVVQFGESKYKFWKNIVSLASIGVGVHCISLREDHQIDLRAIGYYGVYVEGPPQGQGVIYIDNVQIVN
jgi:hypothetical protein